MYLSGRIGAHLAVPGVPSGTPCKALRDLSGPYFATCVYKNKWGGGIAKTSAQGPLSFVV